MRRAYPRAMLSQLEKYTYSASYEVPNFARVIKILDKGSKSLESWNAFDPKNFSSKV